METLPANVSAYKSTPVFTQDSVPKGLLQDHNTKEGVWGRIVVLEGQLEYTILEPNEEVLVLSSEREGVVEPLIKHFIKPLGDVKFYVEFNR